MKHKNLSIFLQKCFVLVFLLSLFLGQAMSGGYYLTAQKADAADSVKNPNQFADPFGCGNDSNSKCFDVGNTSETTDTASKQITDGSTGSVMSPSNLIGDKAQDGAVTFRSVRDYIYIKIPAFDVDQNGFPNSPLVLEVKNKDSIKNIPAITYSHTTNVRAYLSSYLNIKNDLGSTFPYDNLISLTSSGDDSWLTNQIVIPKTQHQRLRSVDGFFQFRIVVPKNNGVSVDFPLDYISIHKINNDQVLAYIKWQAESRGIKEVEYTPENPSPSQDLTFFTTPADKPIFQNYLPAASEIKNDIAMTGTLGSIESSAFSIYTKKDIPDITLQLSDLTDNAGKISSAAIRVRKVVSDYRLWSDRFPAVLNSKRPPTYGFMPDRLEDFTIIDNVQANTSQGFNYQVKIPEDIQSGTYTGKVDILSGSQKIGTFNISLEILAIKLEAAGHDNLVYHSPYEKVAYSEKTDFVFQDMKDHSLDTIISVAPWNCKKGADTNVSCDITGTTNRIGSSIIKGVVDKRAYLNMVQYLADSIITSLGLQGRLYAKLSDPLLETAFKNTISQLQSYAASQGLELIYSVNDEPGNRPEPRLYAYFLNKYIKEAGGKTWVTYYTACEQPITLQCSDSDSTKLCAGSTDIVIPPLTDNIDYKVFPQSEVNQTNIDYDKDSFAYYTTNYSQIRNPIINRYLSGIYADKTEAKAVLNYAYGDYIGDPYIDFDASYNFISPFTYHDFVMAYPTWSGKMIDTFGFEGIREGVMDSEYIATLRKLIKLNPTNPVAQEAQSYLDNTLARLPVDWANKYLSKEDDFGLANVILGEVGASGGNDYIAFDTIRHKIFDFVKELNQSSLVVTSDRKYAMSGTKIKYTVKYKNGYNVKLTSVNFSVPLPIDVEYVTGSASDNGQFDLNKEEITWATDSIAPTSDFEADFEVMAK